MRPRHFVTFLVLLAACVIPCLGQRPGPESPGSGPSISEYGYSIDGTVRDSATGQPLSGVRVILVSRGAPIGTSNTSAEGRFSFAGVPIGEYDIQIEMEGYARYDQDFEVTRLGISSVEVELTKAAAPAAPSPSGPTVSAHQLGVPPKAQREFDKGLDLMNSKADYHGAIAAFDRAIQIFPDYYEAYALEGTAYEGLSDVPSAEKALRKSIELSSSKYPVALYFLAGLLNTTKRYAEAETLARQCLALDDSSWHAHFELAHALLGLRKLDEAEANAKRARDLKPDNPTVFLLLADIHAAERNYSAFVNDLSSFLALTPNGPLADQVRKERALAQQALHDSQSAAPPASPPAQQQ